MFPVGSVVILSGLQSKPELNGKQAIVVGSQGVRVQLQVNGSSLAVKPARLSDAADARRC